MAWNIALCEDNAEDRRLLESAVETWSELRRLPIHLEAFTQPQELRESFHRFDAFLLDIYMPDASAEGWSLAERLRSIDKYAPIIFVTSSEDYLLPAIALQYVIGYVKKPLQTDALYAALDNLLNYLRDHETEAFTFQASFPDGNGERYTGIRRMPYREILFLRREKSRNYVLINDDNEPRIRQTIKELLLQLPVEFRQADKGLIVNMSRIYQLQSHSIVFNDEARTRVEIGSTYQSSLLEAHARRRLQGVM